MKLSPMLIAMIPPMISASVTIAYDGRDDGSDEQQAEEIAAHLADEHRQCADTPRPQDVRPVHLQAPARLDARETLLRGIESGEHVHRRQCRCSREVELPRLPHRISTRGSIYRQDAETSLAPLFRIAARSVMVDFADHENRARRVVYELLADRAKQQAGEPTAASVADHEKQRVARLLQQHLGRLTFARAAFQIERRL